MRASIRVVEDKEVRPRLERWTDATARGAMTWTKELGSYIHESDELSVRLPPGGQAFIIQERGDVRSVHSPKSNWYRDAYRALFAAVEASCASDQAALSPKRQAMTCRDEILATFHRLESKHGRRVFTLAEVLAEMVDHGTRYAPSTIRHNVATRMCASSPASRSYSDLERVGRGQYRRR